MCALSVCNLKLEKKIIYFGILCVYKNYQTPSVLISNLKLRHTWSVNFEILCRNKIVINYGPHRAMTLYIVISLIKIYSKINSLNKILNTHLMSRYYIRMYTVV